MTSCGLKITTGGLKIDLLPIFFDPDTQIDKKFNCDGTIASIQLNFHLLMKSKLLALKEHSGFQRYLKNSGWLMVEQMLRIFAGLLVGVWVARYLAPEQFGIFSYVIAFTAVFSGVAKFGLDAIIVRELINHPERHDSYLGTAFWLKFLGAFIVLMLTAVIVPFTSNDAATNIYIFIITFGLFFQSFEVVEFYFQSQVLARLISICKLIQLIFSSIAKIYLVLVQAELLWFVVVTALDALTLAISYFFAYRWQKNTAFYRHFDRRLAKQLLKDSWPAVLSSIVTMLYMRIDQIMIKEMLGNHELGLYSASIRLVEALYFIPALISNSLFPAILNARNNSNEQYLYRLKLLYCMMFWSGAILSVVFWLIGPAVVSFLYGEKYAGAADVIYIYSISLPFVFVFVASGKWIVAENFIVIALLRNGCAAVVGVVMNFILIPRFGILGGAFSTVVGFAFSSIIFDFLTKRTRGQFFVKLNSIFWL